MLSFFHANAKGTGSALRMEVLPAKPREEGAVMLSLAVQKSLGSRSGSTTVYPHFDWEGKIVVKLGFDELCEMLQVLRGGSEAVAEGKGFFHKSSTGTSKIFFRHIVETSSQFALEITRVSREGEERRARFVFSAVEAIGIESVISGILPVVAFGYPAMESTKVGVDAA